MCQCNCTSGSISSCERLITQACSSLCSISPTKGCPFSLSSFCPQIQKAATRQSTKKIETKKKIATAISNPFSQQQYTHINYAMNHDPYQWGRPSNETYGAYNYNIANANNTEFKDYNHHAHQFPKMNTQQPIITGTSVIASKFANGIIMAADHVGSYGSLLRFNNIERLIKVGSETVVGISGDISDFQYITRLLDELEIDEEVYDNDGGNNLRAPNVHAYLSRVMYNRRSKMDPLWNSIVVGGFDDERKPFLKYVDLLGVTYHASTIATGFGSHLAIPLLRNLIPEDKDYDKVNEDQVRKVVDDSMRVLFYRDARSGEVFSYVVIKLDEESGEVKFEFVKDAKVENQRWRFAKDIRGYASKQQ